MSQVQREVLPTPLAWGTMPRGPPGSSLLMVTTPADSHTGLSRIKNSHPVERSPPSPLCIRGGRVGNSCSLPRVLACQLEYSRLDHVLLLCPPTVHAHNPPPCSCMLTLLAKLHLTCTLALTLPYHQCTWLQTESVS